jgi:dipeptidyl aminopeptidase/acylaminoacyl peptidase
MLTDRYEYELGRLLRTGLAPSSGWDARALAAMADVRPRRHPNLLTYIIVAALILLLAAGVFAAARFLLDAKLQFSDATPYPDPEDEGYTKLLVPHTVGRDLVWEPDGRPIVWQRGHTDLSPDGKQKVFQRGNVRLGFNMHRCDVYLADADGSHERNLTKAAGLGGINCRPWWSPDGTMIAFAHVDPVEGRSPCRAHHQLWVMNADGSDARQLTPEGSLGIAPVGVRWSPDSTRLLACWWVKTDPRALESSVWTAFTVDARTGDIRVLPNVGTLGAWSPGGSRIASVSRKPGTINGEKGKWNQLVLTSADGSNPRVLVQQFISDATIRQRHPPKEHPQGEPVYDDIDQFWYEVGPSEVRWSPKASQIAFVAALPYDPEGPHPKEQRDVWVYDLTTDELLQITDDAVQQGKLSWSDE